MRGKDGRGSKNTLGLSIFEIIMAEITISFSEEEIKFELEYINASTSHRIRKTSVFLDFTLYVFCLYRSRIEEKRLSVKGGTSKRKENFQTKHF